VQGDGAVENLVEALDYFEKSGLVDVIIIGRGGGSIEDLWAFNSEILARKIFSSTTPIISAVGHETDFTICDFVSDMRAPTPSAAAEIAVPDIREITLRVDSAAERLCLALNSVAVRKRERLVALADREVISNPVILLDKMREDLVGVFANVCDAVSKNFEGKKSVLVLKSEKLNALSPLSVISRGFSITEKPVSARMSPADKMSISSFTK
jgi:exodeoxyribonuclease VII large subunit